MAGRIFLKLTFYSKIAAVCIFILIITTIFMCERDAWRSRLISVSHSSGKMAAQRTYSDIGYSQLPLDEELESRNRLRYLLRDPFDYLWGRPWRLSLKVYVDAYNAEMDRLRNDLEEEP